MKSNLNIFYKISDVAQLFRVSRQYIWKLAKEEKIKSIKIGGVIRIPFNEVQRLKGKSNE